MADAGACAPGYPNHCVHLGPEHSPLRLQGPGARPAWAGQRGEPGVRHPGEALTARDGHWQINARLPSRGRISTPDTVPEMDPGSEPQPPHCDSASPRPAIPSPLCLLGVTSQISRLRLGGTPPRRKGSLQGRALD